MVFYYVISIVRIYFYLTTVKLKHLKVIMKAKRERERERERDRERERKKERERDK